MLPHPDGRPYGFRALIPYTRFAEYVRIRDVRVHGERGSRGAAGDRLSEMECEVRLEILLLR